MEMGEKCNQEVEKWVWSCTCWSKSSFHLFQLEATPKDDLKGSPSVAEPVYCVNHNLKCYSVCRMALSGYVVVSLKTFQGRIPFDFNGNRIFSFDCGFVKKLQLTSLFHFALWSSVFPCEERMQEMTWILTFPNAKIKGGIDEWL